MELTLRTSNSTRPVLDLLLPAFEKESGHQVTMILDTAKNSLARIEAGERADAAALLGKNIDKLTSLNILAPASVQPFCRSTIGMAVLSGAPKPDISTVEAFTQTLLNAKSIAHTVHGPSGAYFPELVARLGLTERVIPKTVTRPGGYIGVVVAAGEAEKAYQQICELLAVPVIEEGFAEAEHAFVVGGEAFDVEVAVEARVDATFVRHHRCEVVPRCTGCLTCVFCVETLQGG
jgi:molybdate transport system substrate-binding protein